MSFKLEFHIKGLPKMTNANQGHWTARHREAKKWKSLVVCAVPFDLKNLDCLPLKKAKLTLIRHSTKEPDADGLTSGFKHVIDGLKEAMVIVDDKPSIIGSPTYLWEYSAPSKGFITVRVEEVCLEVGMEVGL